MMKQIVNFIVIGACVPAAVWLYQIQLGAVPFLVLALFLFYLMRTEMKKDRPSAAPSEEILPEKTDKKKAEIVT
ncbi:hypothetical protein [Bacillus badius]|uniref:Lipoprotein n=1 Tax=Bacillus badius TaxID=1455 RepID=A0ABR5AVM7_BACBA|nr:hypothetical protein [Bacillus badius]KIL76582.1 hypothetical protein SD78_0684 [Bacillus badius]KIL78699.1 hypothetical protein SD77_4379 [Bacillus badius]MED4718010.1 hypothetical protein [Bacillus badius]